MNSQKTAATTLWWAKRLGDTVQGSAVSTGVTGGREWFMNRTVYLSDEGTANRVWDWVLGWGAGKTFYAGDPITTAIEEFRDQLDSPSPSAFYRLAVALGMPEVT